MSEYITAALAAVASLVIVSGCSRQDTHSGAPGSEVVFSAGTGSQQTKTSYGETSSGTQAINWTEGDKIRIYSPQAYLRDKSSQHWADYNISKGGTGSSSIVNDEANGLVWSDQSSHTFCGIYPSYAVNSSISVAESGDYNVITATMPSTQTVTKSSDPDTLYNPDMKYAYMYAGASVSGTSSSVALEFKPMFTAFELEVGTTASSTTLTGFVMTAEGKCLSGQYTGTVDCSKNSISYGTSLPTTNPESNGVTVSFGSGVTLTKGHYIRFTVFVIPQTFNITTSGGLTLKFTTDDATKTMTLKTKSGKETTFNANEKFNIKAIDLRSFNLKSVTELKDYGSPEFQTNGDDLDDYGQPESQTGGGGLSDYTLPAMTGITISSKSDTIDVGSTVTLSYTVQPTGAEVKKAEWSSSNETVATVTDGVVTGVAADTATITVTVTDTYGNTASAKCSVTVQNAQPSVLLPGKFTVNSSGNQVQFSSGNLYCYRSSSSSSDWTWDFYADQYQYNSLNTSSSRTAASTDTEIDLFCWGYDASGSVNPVERVGRSSFTDWGSISTLPGNSESTKIWKTLSSAEWTWILGPQSSPDPGTNCRTSSTINGTANARYAEVKVNGVCGLLLFPDAFTWPDGISTSKQPTTFNTNESNWNSVNYTAAEFIKLETAGCVFLPAAGYRDGADLYAAGLGGFYWSSDTPNFKGFTYYLNFYSNYVTPASRYYVSRGASVRLVCTVK